MAGNVAPQKRTTRMVRSFYQEGGPGPLNPLKLFGVGMGYGRVSGVVEPIRGGVTNLSNFAPNYAGYINVGSVDTNPGFGKAEVGITDTQNGIPLPATFGLCPASIYNVVGTDCDVVGDHLLGYVNGYVQVLPDFVWTDNLTWGDMSTYMEDKFIEITGGITIRGDIFAHGQKFFSALATANAADLATNLTTDVVYGGVALCQSCGLGNDGTALKYWSLASTTASPGAKPTVIYQIKNATPVAVSVTSAAASEDLIFIAVVGNQLLVGSKTAGGAGIGGYHYATIGVTGVPGTWTKVVSGFQANHEPTDVLVLSTNEVYFSAVGGYIYKSTNISQGVTVINAGTNTTNDYQRINGNRTLIVLGATSNTIVYSTNGGVSWANSPTTPPTGPIGSMTWLALEVVGRGIWAGDFLNGQVYYSPDLGNSWYLIFNGGAGKINDIYFTNAYEGFFLFTPTGQSSRIYNTFTGGATWWNTSPAIEQLSGYTNIARIAAPVVGVESTRVNNVAAAGNASSTIGLLLTAVPNVF